MRIPLNRPYISQDEKDALGALCSQDRFSGNGFFGKQVSEQLEEKLSLKKVLLTPSCTHALELAALLTQVQPGDEVILPSFTFVSTANAFALRGATLVFVDVRPDTMNLDETLIEGALTSKTRGIVCVHYAGVSCEMNPILDLAKNHGLWVVEDAAHAVGASYRGKACGSLGDLGTFSFHETKNYHCGEGGALLVNREDLLPRAEILRDHGTNRGEFFRGEVERYSWMDLGSNHLLSELQAAFLLPQIQKMEKIRSHRLELWNFYQKALQPLEEEGLLTLPKIPKHCDHNAHLFYFKVKNRSLRTDLLSFLHSKGIGASFHYTPLHSSLAGQKFSRFHGEDRFTTSGGDQLIRLPLYFDLSNEDQNTVVDHIFQFFKPLQVFSTDVRPGLWIQTPAKVQKPSSGFASG